MQLPLQPLDLVHPPNIAARDEAKEDARVSSELGEAMMGGRAVIRTAPLSVALSPELEVSPLLLLQQPLGQPKGRRIAHEEARTTHDD